MTEQEYNAAEGIRRSDLWLMNDSPAKFKYHMDHPEEAEKTPAMIFGSAAHKFILEPADFSNEYAVAMSSIDRRTKAGKEAWEKFIMDNEGKTIISIDDLSTLTGMANAVLDCGLAIKMLAGQSEVPFFWKDPETGIACKCKADCVRQIDDRYIIVDYKTTLSAQTEKFNAEIFKRGYMMQAAMYAEGVQIALGLDYRPGFFFVAQEKKAPYAVNVIEVSEDVMQYGSRVFHDLLRRYHECKEVDIWPSYCGDVANETTLPGWIGLWEDEEV